MALGSEGFFSPEGLQGGESRRGEGESSREAGKEGASRAAPDGVPPSFSKVSHMRQQDPSGSVYLESWPACAVLSVVPAAYRLLFFAARQLFWLYLAVKA